MDSKFDIQLMVNVARLYYIDGLKQEEIAKKVKISRSLISMILTEAKEVGIVEINIKNPLLNNNELAEEIQNKFKIKECFILQTTVKNIEILRKLVSLQTIEILKNKIEDNFTIGIGWGRTCYEIISNFKPGNVYKNVSVVPLLGGSNQSAYYFQLNEMTRKFSENINGISYFIHAPLVGHTPEESEMFLNSQTIMSIIKRWKKIDIAIFGIGSIPDPNADVRERFNGEREIFKQLEKDKAIGDVCARYFNIDGKFIENDFDKRLIGISIENLKKAKLKICTVAGIEKASAITGALKTELIDVFVSDENTVKQILKLDNKNQSMS